MYRSLMRDEEGRPSGMRMLSLDVTEEKRELEEARRARLWLESVIASLADAVLVTDALGFIRSANPAAETLFGWRFAELEGKLIEKALPVLSYVSDDPTKLSFTMSLAGHCRGIATILDRESREVRVEIGTSPILNKESGFTEGVVAVLRTLEQAA
jgi:PAS domain S-box-containing protein